MQPFDPNTKLYVEYAPDESTIKELLGLQSKIIRSVPGLIVPRNELHFTLIHIGKLSNVITELRDYGADVNESRIKAAVQTLAAQSRLLLPDAIGFVPTGLELYGSRQSVIVLEGVVDNAIVEAHVACLNLLEDFLRTVSGTDPKEFMRQNHNLRHSLTLQPHVSLIRSSRQMLPQPPLRLGLAEALRFTVMPLVHDLKLQA